MANRDIYVAIRTFMTDIDGVRVIVTSGKTFVRAGHELMNGREHLFRKVEPQYEVASKRSPRNSLPTELDDVQLLEVED